MEFSVSLKIKIRIIISSTEIFIITECVVFIVLVLEMSVLDNIDCLI